MNVRTNERIFVLLQYCSKRTRHFGLPFLAKRQRLADIVVRRGRGQGEHSPECTWRHLDLWQCKTFITARIPRYLVDGKVVSLEVPCHNAKEACLHIGLMVMCRTSPSNENLTSIILTIFKRVKYEEPCDGRLSSTIP